MKKWQLNLQWVLLYLGVWCILFERIDVPVIVSGIIVSIASLHLTEKYLMGLSYDSKFPLNIIWLLKYGFFLIIEIYKAGFATMKMVLTKEINPGVVDIHTDMKEAHKVALLANSITLTPGTVTIDKQGQQLKVLWLNVTTRDPEEAGQAIKGEFEKHF